MRGFVRCGAKSYKRWESLLYQAAGSLGGGVGVSGSVSMKCTDIISRNHVRIGKVLLALGCCCFLLLADVDLGHGTDNGWVRRIILIWDILWAGWLVR
ncbi:hypothetical protein QBC36DRAFT_325607 [Triangularia setosa]|uniref:Uncharacterized protein n=1 Tax=Triangularia setosa TaxID=2587417 RepID=A0AAN7AA58_9PEZI|nr:hypothetical protein QBC36DRAFT_325607 [Podospora setosa]